MTFLPMYIYNYSVIALTQYIMVNWIELRLLTNQIYKSTIVSADDWLQEMCAILP